MGHLNPDCVVFVERIEPTTGHGQCGCIYLTKQIARQRFHGGSETTEIAQLGAPAIDDLEGNCIELRQCTAFSLALLPAHRWFEQSTKTTGRSIKQVPSLQ
jgi:hypothetical protein